MHVRRNTQRSIPLGNLWATREKDLLQRSLSAHQLLLHLLASLVSVILFGNVMSYLPRYYYGVSALFWPL